MEHKERQSLEALRDSLRQSLQWIEQLLQEDLQQPQMTLPGLQMAWGKRVSKVFKERVKWIEEQLDIPADYLMACMAFESGETFDSDIRNPKSTATGLIQFMSFTAKRLGTTTDKLAIMTPEDQLNYVYKYFRDYKGKLKTLADVYMAILWPAAIGKPDDYPIFLHGDDNYVVNAGLDVNKDHIVTKGEAAAKVQRKLVTGLMAENFG